MKVFFTVCALEHSILKMVKRVFKMDWRVLKGVNFILVIDKRNITYSIVSCIYENIGFIVKKICFNADS